MVSACFYKNRFLMVFCSNLRPSYWNFVCNFKLSIIYKKESYFYINPTVGRFMAAWDVIWPHCAALGSGNLGNQFQRVIIVLCGWQASKLIFESFNQADNSRRTAMIRMAATLITELYHYTITKTNDNYNPLLTPTHPQQRSLFL